MEIIVSKNDLIRMVKGTSPNYKHINYLTEHGLGEMRGGHNNYWAWNEYALEKLTEEEIWTLYKYII